jgi:hypothetical protein
MPNDARLDASNVDGEPIVFLLDAVEPVGVVTL